MDKSLAVIGGDLRNIRLIQMFEKQRYKIYIYGLEKAEELRNKENIIFCKSIEELSINSKIIIGPIPFSKNGTLINSPFSQEEISIEEVLNGVKSKILIAGTIKEETAKIAKDNNTKIIDIMKKEEIAILNTIATAEGTIEIAIANTEKTISKSNILILGFGRVGKTLCSKFMLLNANVTCASINEEDIAWCTVYGYNSINLNLLDENINNYDIIINTIPNKTLTEEEMKNISKETLIIDLASNLGGIDKDLVEKYGLNYIWALGIPGKVAPYTSAEIIKESISNILKEEK